MGEVIALLVILTFVFIIAGIPIYISLMFTGLLSLVALASSTATPLATLVIPQSIFNGIGSLPLLAIPFFMLAGEIMNRGKITEKLIRFAMLLIGRLPASLGLSSIVASMFFGGITGSAQASTSCMGGILIPAMKRGGWNYCCGFYLRANYPAEYHHGCICHRGWVFGWSNVYGRPDTGDSGRLDTDDCIAGP